MKPYCIAVLAATVFLGTSTISIANPPLSKCVPGQKRAVDEYCLVDGDTIWIDGEKLRMVGYDTPEPMSRICGGEREIALAHEASDRALELLNGSEWTTEYGGLDKTGQRTLVTIRIGGRNIGDILIEERLAVIYPDGDEWWCDLR